MLVTAGIGASLIAWGGAVAAPVQIYAAGSLTAAMQAMIEASGLPASDVAKPVYGPAGLLRERLSNGEKADLFVSADTAQPLRLRAADSHVLVVPFIANRMCVASKASAGLTDANLLAKLLDPKVRLATSTPVADPGGDYAMAVFDKAEHLRPGAAAVLKAKALHLLGSPNAMVPVAGHSPASTIFLTDRADALLYYCSGSPGLLKEVEGLASLPLPAPLEVHPIYAMALMSENPTAARLALFMASTEGQAILTRYGFLPLAPGMSPAGP